MIADLHCHSYYSDGDLPPSELAVHCKQSGSEVFALTDHDTMLGAQEAAEAAAELGLKFLPGVEISAYERCNVHILGYRVDYKNPKFIAFSENMAQARRDRMVKTVRLFEKNGMEITMDEVMSYARANPSRVHIARAALARGYAGSIKEVFDTFLKEGGPCYVPNDALSPVEAVRLITETGGIPVIAHPVRLKLDIETHKKAEGRRAQRCRGKL